MELPNDDIVLIQVGKTPGDPAVVTVNCPDKPGLGCDLCRIILEFGLSITRADFSTDGRWCYIVFWVIPHSSSDEEVDWGNLKNRLSSVCPSCLVSFFNPPSSNKASPSSLYLLKFWCLDRTGLLHDVIKVLTKLELTTQRVKVMTTPDGRVLDLFFITDVMELLHTKKRQDETRQQLIDASGEYCVSCELELAGPEYINLQGFSSLPPAIADELFCNEPLETEKENSLQALSSDLKTLNKASITVDNLLSPAHTLLQIQCYDQKGLFYDILRTSKDRDIQITYGRISTSTKGYRNMDLFIRDKDGKKILDPKHQASLCCCLKQEMLQPLRVIIVNRGPDTELLVANPVELSGHGRPRVFYDVTSALKTLGICIFSAEIARHSTADGQWEVYRFLLEDSHEFPLASRRARSQIVERVTKTLMGW